MNKKLMKAASSINRESSARYCGLDTQLPSQLSSLGVIQSHMKKLESIGLAHKGWHWLKSMTNILLDISSVGSKVKPSEPNIDFHEAKSQNSELLSLFHEFT